MNAPISIARRKGMALALATAITLAAAGCTTTSTPPTADPDILSVAASAAVTTWDPIKSFSTEALYLGNVYETLLWANTADAAEPFTPGLAESWTTSEDGLSWTFTIREGATFHDGEPVNASAVKASIEAAKERGGASFIWAPLDRIDVPDETTVIFNLKWPAPIDLIAASTYGSWIVSPKALTAAANDENYFEEGVDAGSGPYQLKSYTPGSEVVLERFDDYWNVDAAAHYGIVDISITPDAVTALQMLNAGEVDISTTIPIENVKDLAADSNYTVRDSNSPFSYVALFNTLRPPLDNPKVRQALSYAMPYDDIIAVGSQGYGSQSRGPAPKGIFPYTDSAKMYTQDLEKAAELLAQAGHEGGGFTLNLTYAAENPSEARFVPLIKDAFAKIGVTVDVRAELFSQQWEQGKADPANAQDIFVLYYWPTYSDAGADNMWSLFYHTEKPFFNLAYWNNPAYDALLDEAGPLTGTDKDAAAAKYHEAMDVLYEEAPGVFFYDVRAVSVVPKGLSIPAFNENYPFTVFFAPIRPTE